MPKLISTNPAKNYEVLGYVNVSSLEEIKQKVAEAQTKLSGETPAVVAPIDTTKEGLLREASETYEAAIRAQREGDWGRYGEEIKKLGEILSKLR